MSIKNINVISRNPDNYLRETKHDLYKVQRNYDPNLHPFEAAREYKLAMNATKLERVFAKPFITSLSHSESVSAACKHPSQLSCAYTGTAEGEIKFWNLQTRKCLWSVQAHFGQVWDITSSCDGNYTYSVGNDKTIKKWSLEQIEECNAELPSETWICDTIITGITHHQTRDEFITCGERVLLWDASTKAPKFSYDWGTTGDKNEATVACVKFNPVETELFASSDFGNNLVLYDIRAKEVKKLKMTHRINSLSWNPMEAFILTAASEDYNCYSFDIRKMDNKNRVVSLHEGHTSAVISLCYSPTGKEFCTASYDKSIRIFRVDETKSRDVYHTKRMFKVNTVLWSGDNKYILSGSSDHNLRLWKASSSEKLGIMRGREKAAINYAQELKKKYSDFPEIKRIARHRHLPKHVYNATKEHRAIRESEKRKESNRRKNSKPGTVPLKSSREKSVVGLQDEASAMQDESSHGESD